MKLRTLAMSIVAVGSLIILPGAALGAGASTTFTCSTATVTIVGSAASSLVSTCTGTASDGSKEKIEIPSNFNGNFVLYSHGYVFDGPTGPYAPAAADAFSTQVADYLLV